VADLFEQRERNVPLASADVRGGGILRDEPKERLRRRLRVVGKKEFFIINKIPKKSQRFSGHKLSTLSQCFSQANVAGTYLSRELGETSHVSKRPLLGLEV